MGKSKVYYLTAELNNATWILNKHKGHAFEDYIYGVVYNVPIDVDIKFDPNPISWTLKIPLILFHGHLLILLSG